MRFLREQLDDPDPSDCGRCDNCGGTALSGEVGDAAVDAAVSALGRPGVPFDARRMWPTAMPALGIDVRGKLAGTEQAESGRAIARFTDLGFGARLRSLLAPDADDRPVPGDVFDACVQVLASWDWQQRPAVVVRIGSTRRPTLVADLAARLADTGRLVDLGEVAHVGPSTTGRSNSALRLRDVWAAYELPATLGAQLDGRPVLLVDDLVDTGWTFTVVTRLLRRAGAGEVYPFALALAA
jgi:ATP-dependent DNA helicase RecQ